MSGQERTGADIPGRAAGKPRLDSWKEIAAYFGRTERTVRRWEAELGLPVRRTPGQQQSRVHADVADLEAWRRGAPTEIARPEAVEPSPPAGGDGDPYPRTATAARPPWIARAVGVASLAAIALVTLVGVPRGGFTLPSLSPPHRPPLAAQRLYVAGMDDWAKRTPASLNRAVDEFRAAIAEDPRYAEAYAGLALTYDLLREYTRMPQDQAYGLAREAASHALALDERLSSAHAALAFADAFGFWDAAAGKLHFGRAVALDPANATAHHWYATFLLQQARPADALRQIDAARALEPASIAIAADRAFILDHLGRGEEAVAILRSLEKSRPNFLSPHAYLAELAFNRGHMPEFLDERLASARLAGDASQGRDLAAAARALASGGRGAMIASLLASEEARYEAGGEDAYSVADWAAWAGERALALHFLGLSADRHEARFAGAPMDLAFAGLRDNPSFRALVARLGPSKM